MTTRTSYIKPNSATQINAKKFVSVVCSVVKLAQIDADTRNEVLFETGCALVEQYLPTGSFAHSLLHDATYGFWAWWMVEFLKDDEALVEYRPDIFVEHEYRKIKEAMLTDKDVIDRLVFFVNRTMEINF